MPAVEEALIKVCDTCKLPLTLNDFYKRNDNSYFKDCKDCHKDKCWSREKITRGNTNSDIIDLADEFLSFHGIDFLKLVKERNKKKGW